jgi:RimJ/RimL family protein N-acetyltransferase
LLFSRHADTVEGAMLKAWRTRRASRKATLPDKLKATYKLRDGVTLRLRPIKPTDDLNLLDLYHRLSPASLYHRFFTVPKPDPDYARYLADADCETHFALVGEIKNQLVAVARFHRQSATDERAEAAITVADDWHGKGIGTLLLKKLAEVATSMGVTTFECQVAMDNDAMIRLISRSGFRFTKERKPGFFTITILINSGQ